MSTPTHIIDGSGTKSRARVTSKNELVVTTLLDQVSDSGTASRFRYLSQLLSSNGDGTGTTNQSVDGSSATQEFSINASADYDIRISQIAIVLIDATVLNKQFGGSGVLSNGWTLKISELGDEINIIVDATTLGEVLTQSNNLLIPSAATTQANVIGEVNAAGDASFI